MTGSLYSRLVTAPKSPITLRADFINGEPRSGLVHGSAPSCKPTRLAGSHASHPVPRTAGATGVSPSSSATCRAARAPLRREATTRAITTGGRPLRSATAGTRCSRRHIMCCTEAMSPRHTTIRASAAQASGIDGDPTWIRPKSANTGAVCSSSVAVTAGHANVAPCSAVKNPGTTRSRLFSSCAPSCHRSRRRRSWLLVASVSWACAGGRSARPAPNANTVGVGAIGWPPGWHRSAKSPP